MWSVEVTYYALLKKFAVLIFLNEGVAQIFFALNPLELFNLILHFYLMAKRKIFPAKFEKKWRRFFF